MRVRCASDARQMRVRCVSGASIHQLAKVDRPHPYWARLLFISPTLARRDGQLEQSSVKSHLHLEVEVLGVHILAQMPFAADAIEFPKLH